MNITINAIELASELAAYELHENWQDSIQIFDIEDEEETKYTEEAQEIFDGLYDKYLSLIESFEVKSKVTLPIMSIYDHFKG
jgi:hypothetical protein